VQFSCVFEKKKRVVDQEKLHPSPVAAPRRRRGEGACGRLDLELTGQCGLGPPRPRARMPVQSGPGGGKRGGTGAGEEKNRREEVSQRRREAGQQRDPLAVLALYPAGGWEEERKGEGLGLGKFG
jgi:hypothetical protein